MSGRAEAHDGGLGPSREHTGAARGGGWDEGGDDFDQDQWEEDEPGVDDWEEDQGFDDAAGFEGGYPHQGSYPDAWAYPERYPAHAQSYGSPFGYPSTSYGFGCGGWEAPWGPPPPPPPHAWGPRPGPFHSPPPMPHMGWGSPGWPGWGTTGGLPWESPPPPSPHRSKAGAGKGPAPKPRADSLEIEEIAEQTAQVRSGLHGWGGAPDIGTGPTDMGQVLVFAVPAGEPRHAEDQGHLAGVLRGRLGHLHFVRASVQEVVSKKPNSLRALPVLPRRQSIAGDPNHVAISPALSSQCACVVRRPQLAPSTLGARCTPVERANRQAAPPVAIQARCDHPVPVGHA